MSALPLDPSPSSTEDQVLHRWADDRSQLKAVSLINTGATGFVIRASGVANAENCRLWPVERCCDNAGDATIEAES